MTAISLFLSFLSSPSLFIVPKPVLTDCKLLFRLALPIRRSISGQGGCLSHKQKVYCRYLFVLCDLYRVGVFKKRYKLGLLI